MTERVVIGDCTLYRGDCLEILPEIGSVDLVVMDPPYLINSKSNGAGKLSPWADICNGAYWFAAVYRACREQLSDSGALWTFLNWRTFATVQKAAIDAGWSIESLLVWDKCWIGPGGHRGLRPSYEMVALMAEGGFTVADRSLPDIKRVKWCGHKPTGHAAEKPAELVRWLIEISGGGRICDPFLGSGTGGVAAVQAGHPFVGIEQDAEWFDFACRRIEAAYRDRAALPAAA